MNYAHGQQASGLLPHQVWGGLLCLACLQCLFTANNFAMLLCCEVILPYSEGESLPKIHCVVNYSVLLAAVPVHC